nr:40s ribosomal protein s12 [Quercus suber]
MSDGEEPTNIEEVPAAEEVEVAGDASAGGKDGSMSVLDALKGVLKIALIHDGLARGLREASKALDRRQAHMCVLNEACEEEAYKKLVVALCGEHKIPLIKVPDGKQLGEWAGLCQIDREGNARKVVNCSCVVVKDWGEESQERSILLNYFQTEHTCVAETTANANKSDGLSGFRGLVASTARLYTSTVIDYHSCRDFTRWLGWIEKQKALKPCHVPLCHVILQCFAASTVFVRLFLEDRKSIGTLEALYPVGQHSHSLRLNE